MRDMRVLILGGGTMQLPAIRGALSRGWTVSVADGNPKAPGADLCRHFLPVDLRNVEEMIDAARGLMQKEGLDGVFTAGTDFSYTVARVAKALGLPGIDPEVARAASDKVLMREVFEQKGISAPRFVQITPEEDYGGRVSKLSFPLVVKPVDNMGARGVRKVESCNELEAALSEAFVNSRSGRAIVEEFVDGPEFSIDALVEKGDVIISGFADRIIRFAPFFVELGHTLPSEAEPSLRRQVEETFIEAVHALGIDNGAAKGDVKWDGRKAVVGEVAARLSGGYMSGWTFPYATGVDLTGAALNIAVGLPAGSLEAKKEMVSAERAIVSIPGTVERLEGVEEAKAIEGVEELFLRAAPGDEVRFPYNNVEKCGNVIAVAEMREEAIRSAEEATQRAWVHLRPGDKRTEAFLFRREEGWVEDAFDLNVPKNHRALSAMPAFRLYGVRGYRARPKLLVRSLPSLELEDGEDWHGNGLERSAERALAHCRAVLIGSAPADEGRVPAAASSSGFGESAGEAEDTAELRGGSTTECVVEIASLFWIALLRGGLQGAVWLLETVAMLVEEGRDLELWAGDLRREEHW